jgi:hypothetical protein
MVNLLSSVSKILNFLIPTLIVLGVCSYIQKSDYPRQSEIAEELAQEPIQAETERRDYIMSYRDSQYGIQPMANYEIWGLVVSKNNINAFDDIYHTADSVDVQDLCLVWGDNLDLAKLKKVKFWSEPFSCHIEVKDGDIYEWFNQSQLSNTHLLSEDESIRKLIRRMEIGDQIRLAGKLINYHPAGASERLRRSSLRRDDTGDGACEVMMVEEAEILHAPNNPWRLAYRIAMDALAVLIVVKLLFFLGLPYLEFKARHPG